MKKLLTDDVKYFFSSIMDTLELGMNLQKKGRVHAYITLVPARQFCQEIYDIVMPDLPMLCDKSVEDLMVVLNAEKMGHFPANVLDSIVEDTITFLQKNLLPAFLPSQDFVEFLLHAEKDCLFVGRSKDPPASDLHNTADAQGQKRACIDPDDYIDTGYLHGGQQRMKVTKAYPQLKQR